MNSFTAREIQLDKSESSKNLGLKQSIARYDGKGNIVSWAILTALLCVKLYMYDLPKI